MPGVDIVADGEMRRDNFYSFVVEKLGGMRLMKLSQLLDYMKDRAGFEEILRGLDVPGLRDQKPDRGRAAARERRGNGARRGAFPASSIPAARPRCRFRGLIC